VFRFISIEAFKPSPSSGFIDFQLCSYNRSTFAAFYQEEKSGLLRNLVLRVFTAHSKIINRRMIVLINKREGDGS